MLEVQMLPLFCVLLIVLAPIKIIRDPSKKAILM